MKEKKNVILDTIISKLQDKEPVQEIRAQSKISSIRMKCIDAFRGLAIASMFIMENPGNPGHVSNQFRHAPWNGLTWADFGYPFFIFIAGAVLPHSIKKRQEKGYSKPQIYMYIIYRAVAIFLVGIFLNGFPNFNFSTIRIAGALQRIAVVYLVAGILVLETNALVQGIASIFILVFYSILLKYVNVPGYGSGILAQDGNLVQYVDMLLLKGHMYTTTWDPEGIISTIPAISTILFGVLSGQILFWDKISKAKKTTYLLIAGAVSITMGMMVSGNMPINKNLWSSSFVFYTGGWACIILGLCYLVIDIIGHDTLLKPFIILGGYPMIAYVGLELVRKTIWLIQIPDKVSSVSLPLYQFLCNHLVTPWAGSVNDSYYFSILYTLLWVLIIKIFYASKELVKSSS